MPRRRCRASARRPAPAGSRRAIAAARVQSTGRPVPPWRARIVGVDHQRVPAGAVGSAPAVAQRRRPERSAPAAPGTARHRRRRAAARRRGRRPCTAARTASTETETKTPTRTRPRRQRAPSAAARATADGARAARPQHEADGVDVGRAGGRDVVEAREPADLDAHRHHAALPAWQTRRSAASGSARRHQPLADEERAVADARAAADVVGRADAALAHRDHPGRQPRGDPRRDVEIHGQRPQVAVVDADDGRAGVDRARQFAFVVHFDQHGQVAAPGPAACSRASRSSSSALTISSTASAPAARASSSW